jgi:hypothetical protein
MLKARCGMKDILDRIALQVPSCTAKSNFAFWNVSPLCILLPTWTLVTGYGLEARVRFPAKAKDLCLRHIVQTVSGAHLASYPLGAANFFHCGWCNWFAKLGLTSKMVELHFYSPIRFYCVVLNYLSTGTNLPYFYIRIIDCVKQVNKGRRCSF